MEERAFKKRDIHLTGDFTDLPVILAGHSEVEFPFFRPFGAAEDVKIRRPGQFSQQR